MREGGVRCGAWTDLAVSDCVMHVFLWRLLLLELASLRGGGEHIVLLHSVPPSLFPNSSFCIYCFLSSVLFSSVLIYMSLCV